MAYMNSQGVYSVERDILNETLDPEGSDGQLLRLAIRAYDMHFTYHLDFWSYYCEWHNHYIITDEDMDIFRQFEFNCDKDYEHMMDRVVHTLWARFGRSQ